MRRKYVRLAQAGSAVGQCFAGVLLAFHEPLGASLQQGFVYLLSCQNIPLAALFLALCFESGRGTERSLPSARDCYHSAIHQGLQVAEIFLAESTREVGWPLHFRAAMAAACALSSVH